MAEKKFQEGNVGGYARVGVEKGDETFNAGYSIYSAAWPLLQEYPGQCFQSGLFGTWMFPQNDKEPPVKLYTDIEGGLGWWRDTEYATTTPKFIMGGVALNFVAWANGPGAGQGRDWDAPKGKYGIAQLSPNLLWPPDGVNLKEGTAGELFGYGYLPLPLAETKSTTAGVDVPTGDQCWTLFLNTETFKGPATFFLPYFWTEASVDDPRLAGMFLDTRPSKHDRNMSMETQHIPWAQATDANGQLYARMAPTLFPVGEDGDSLVLHGITSYSKAALWDKVKPWLDGGDAVEGTLDPDGTHHHDFDGKGGLGWRVWLKNTENKIINVMSTETFLKAAVPNGDTFGYSWDESLVKRSGNLITLPEYFRFEPGEGEEPGTWIAIPPEDVPAETGLADVDLNEPMGRTPQTYVTPEDPDSCWKTPGPAAGPFEAYPHDGSVVTYYWYRFADQPALLNADMNDAEREAMQGKVDKIHANWNKDQEYLAPPKTGVLAEIDPALIVTPPEGLEVGYVPIVTKQAPADGAPPRR